MVYKVDVMAVVVLRFCCAFWASVATAVRSIPISLCRFFFFRCRWRKGSTRASRSVHHEPGKRRLRGPLRYVTRPLQQMRRRLVRDVAYQGLGTGDQSLTDWMPCFVRFRSTFRF